jgi:hypothetical protein
LEGVSLVLSPTQFFSALARGRSRRFAALRLLALILTAAAWTPMRGEAASVVAMTTTPADCGSGPNWPTKIGTDSQARQVDLTSPPTSTTVAQLTNLPLPSPIVHRVQPTETTVYTITARLKAIHTEHDRDLHFVVDDGLGHYMITELPDPACVPTTSPFYSGISRARSQVAGWSGSLPATVQISGVGFFDNFNGQPDQAPNQIELHPILNLNFNPAPAGLLRVTSSPAVPTQVLIDGQIADSWGLTWLELAAGTHTACFTHVEGWTEPPCQTLSVEGGATTTVTGNFTERGSLRVITSPAVPSQITVDGNPTNDWGTWTDISTGSHTVCFGAVAGFDPPVCQTFAVNAGALTTVTGTFTPNQAALGQNGLGLLRLTTSPAVSSQITITPSGRSQYIADSSGLNWLELAPGSYTVSFSHVGGYTEPPPQTLTITSGNTTTVTGAFIRRGFLRVTTSPAVAATIRVDGIPRNNWGMWTDIDVGSHTVCFGLAPGYANTPACQTVTVNAGVETDVTGVYS